MNRIGNLVIVILVFSSSILLSQTNEETQKASLLENSWNMILKESARRLGILSNSESYEEIKIDSSFLSVKFTNDSSQLIAESVVYSKKKSISIDAAENMVNHGLLHQIQSLNRRWAKIDSAAILNYIRYHKIPLVKKLNYRPRVYVRATYKVALNMNGNRGLLAFLQEQEKILAEKRKTTKKYSGLIIDARNFYITKCPLISIKCGIFNIYGPETVDRKKLLESGMALWADNVQNDKMLQRVGNDPLILTPIKITDDCTFVLDGKYAKILTKNYFKKLLRNCSVVILR